MGVSFSQCDAEPEQVEAPQQEHEEAADAEEPEHHEEQHEEQHDEGSEEEEPEEEEPAAPQIVLRTAPHDARFPSTNQARHCYTRYNEFYKCKFDKGEDAEECTFYQRAYRSLCPNEWVEKWNEARDEGTWPGKY